MTILEEITGRVNQLGAHRTDEHHIREKFYVQDIRFLLDTIAQQDKEIEKLTKQLDNSRVANESISRHSNVILSERDTARAVLTKFGRHKTNCSRVLGELEIAVLPCTCGLTAAMEANR